MGEAGRLIPNRCVELRSDADGRGVMENIVEQCCIHSDNMCCDWFWLALLRIKSRAMTNHSVVRKRFDFRSQGTSAVLRGEGQDVDATVNPERIHDVLQNSIRDLYFQSLVSLQHSNLTWIPFFQTVYRTLWETRYFKYFLLK